MHHLLRRRVCICLSHSKKTSRVPGILSIVSLQDRPVVILTDTENVTCVSVNQEEAQETDEFRDVSAKVERREALVSLRKAADIINATVQVRHCLRQNGESDCETAVVDPPLVSGNPMLYNQQHALRKCWLEEPAVLVFVCCILDHVCRERPEISTSLLGGRVKTGQARGMPLKVCCSTCYSLEWKALMNNDQNAALSNVRREKMHGICCCYRHVQGINHDSWQRIADNLISLVGARAAGAGIF